MSIAVPPAPNYELVDRHLKLAELAAKRFDERRGYEWKVVLGFWAAMMFAVRNELPIHSVGPHVLFVVVILFALTWIRGIWAANESDKRRYEIYFRRAQAELDGVSRELPPEGRVTFRDSLDCVMNWNSQFQFLATAAIAALLYLSQPAHIQEPTAITAPAENVLPPVPGPGFGDDGRPLKMAP